MKLYTEEQVRATWNAAFIEGMSIDSEIYEPVFFENHLNTLTPIELPSDEEIITEVSRSNLGLGYDFSMFIGFKQGAKYVINYIINKIQEGKND